MFEVNLRRNLSVHPVCVVWVGHSSGIVPFNLILAHPCGSVSVRTDISSPLLVPN